MNPLYSLLSLFNPCKNTKPVNHRPIQPTRATEGVDKQASKQAYFSDSLHAPSEAWQQSTAAWSEVLPGGRPPGRWDKE